MMSGQRPQTSPKATPLVLGYERPTMPDRALLEQRSIVTLGIRLSAVHFAIIFLGYIVGYVVIRGSDSQAADDGFRAMLLILALPVALLGLFKLALPLWLGLAALAANSLLYGFGIASIAHWLDRRRLRRL